MLLLHLLKISVRIYRIDYRAFIRILIITGWIQIQMEQQMLMKIMKFLRKMIIKDYLFYIRFVCWYSHPIFNSDDVSYDSDKDYEDDEYKETLFDNAFVLVDEVHNVTNKHAILLIWDFDQRIVMSATFSWNISIDDSEVVYSVFRLELREGYLTDYSFGCHLTRSIGTVHCLMWNTVQF